METIDLGQKIRIQEQYRCSIIDHDRESAGTETWWNFSLCGLDMLGYRTPDHELNARVVPHIRFLLLPNSVRWLLAGLYQVQDKTGLYFPGTEQNTVLFQRNLITRNNVLQWDEISISHERILPVLTVAEPVRFWGNLTRALADITYVAGITPVLLPEQMFLCRPQGKIEV